MRTGGENHDAIGSQWNCYRCSRPIELMAPDGGLMPMPRWLPTTYAERADCPERSGQHCTPYGPE